ncbi:MAG: lamin tail domain-containing protein [Anaerolineae bacterium]|nr:lamin tail domain-containing protein [Anaerolineae bacterium]MDW8171905.1 lamin tail domain-containing protein [Anaerolineae bacterium]
MALRNALPLLLAVFIVAVGGAFLGLQLFGAPSGEGQRIQIVTVAVLITQTPDPNSTPTFDPTAVEQIVGTRVAEALSQPRTQVAVPPGVLPNDPALANLTVIAPGGTPIGVAQAGGAQSATLSLPQNCIAHTVVAGDSPFGVAAQYGANPFLVMQVNGLDDVTAARLQIGDMLIVPLEGCPVDQLPAYQPAGVARSLAQATAPQPTATPVTTLAPALAGAAEAISEPQLPTPTLTLAPTAANAQIEIVGVERPGDVTAEGIRIRNNGNTVNVTGWRLSDGQGNTFVFPEQLIFSNGEVTIYTRAGQKTPIVLFWGLDRAVWEAGDVATLSNPQGVVQASFRVPSPSDLP